MARILDLDDVLARLRGVDGGIRWPEDPASCLELCTALWGYKTVQSHDYWINWAMEFVRSPNASPQYRQEDGNWRSTQHYRTSFATLSDAQRDAIQRLLVEMAGGFLHSFLVNLDRVPHTSTDVIFYDPESDRKLASLREDGILDFQAYMYDWLDSYSTFHKAQREEPSV